MIWKRAVLVLTIIIAVILAIVAVKPSSTTEFEEHLNVRASESQVVKFAHPVPIKSLAIDGSWEGPGYAEVWIEGEGKQYLVMDTSKFDVMEFSGFGFQFDSACMQTCSMPPIVPESIVILVSGPGLLSIDEYRYSTPIDPSGLALCPNCQRVRQPATPDHALLMLVILLVIAIVGAHSLGHFCTNPTRKRILIILFLGAFITLVGVFGVAVAAPAKTAAAAREAASVISAFGLLILFIMFGVEMLGHKKNEPQKSNVWTDLEEAEEQWERKK